LIDEKSKFSICALKPRKIEGIKDLAEQTKIQENREKSSTYKT
jgi:hypothetical protein